MDALEGRFSGRPVAGAVTGAIIGIVLFFVPGSTLLGGAIAGYLVGARGQTAVATGALAGAIMYLPVPVIVAVFGGVIPFGPITGGGLLVVWTVLFVYTVGVGALGGYVGGYLRSTRGGQHEPTTGGERSLWTTIAHGAVGGVAGVLLAFIPFSTVLGGAIAGYLEGGSARHGAVVGTIAGLVALAPFVLLAAVFVGVLGILGGLVGAAVGVLAVVLLAGSLVYVVGFSILGGVLGVYLRRELR